MAFSLADVDFLSIVSSMITITFTVEDVAPKRLIVYLYGCTGVLCPLF